MTLEEVLPRRDVTMNQHFLLRTLLDDGRGWWRDGQCVQSTSFSIHDHVYVQ